ncbi:hypothetical protein [Hutsoniella sourekii]|uniref:hypothetical protein n=1 Tax=Hutsoniella sourekii TaxID=87650 RepID=UPI0004846A11|nr:hypothetical protein [Hutsoniella sourekii]
MLNILILAFPTILVILASYLLLYRQSLMNLLKIKSSKAIISFAITYYILAILGFFLILNQIINGILIWLLACVLFTLLMIFVFYLMAKN